MPFSGHSDRRRRGRGPQQDGRALSGGSKQDAHFFPRRTHGSDTAHLFAGGRDQPSPRFPAGLVPEEGQGEATVWRACRTALRPGEAAGLPGETRVLTRWCVWWPLSRGCRCQECPRRAHAEQPPRLRGAHVAVAREAHLAAPALALTRCCSKD